MSLCDSDERRVVTTTGLQRTHYVRSSRAQLDLAPKRNHTMYGVITKRSSYGSASRAGPARSRAQDSTPAMSTRRRLWLCVGFGGGRRLDERAVTEQPFGIMVEWLANLGVLLLSLSGLSGGRGQESGSGD